MTDNPATTETTVRCDHLRDALKACLLVQPAAREALPILKAVQVIATEKQIVLCSTDRFRLVRVTIDLADPGPEWSALIDAADVKRILAALPTHAHESSWPIMLGVTDGRATVKTYESEATYRPVDGQFPNTEALIKDDTAPTDVIGFDPAYMKSLCAMPGRHRGEAVRVTFNGLKPMRSEWGESPVSYTFLLMPARIPS